MILHDTERILSPDFFKKCQIEPNSKDQWQIANFISGYKSTHSIGTIFDGIRFGPVFLLSKDFFYNVWLIIKQKECNRSGDGRFACFFCSWIEGRKKARFPSASRLKCRHSRLLLSIGNTVASCMTSFTEKNSFTHFTSFFLSKIGGIFFPTYL